METAELIEVLLTENWSSHCTRIGPTAVRGLAESAARGEQFSIDNFAGGANADLTPILLFLSAVAGLVKAGLELERVKRESAAPNAQVDAELAFQRLLAESTLDASSKEKLTKGFRKLVTRARHLPGS